MEPEYIPNMHRLSRVRPVGIPSALWARLSRLDHRCNIELRREDVSVNGVGRGTGRLYDRKWVVVIRDRSGREGQMVKCEAPAMVQALAAALEDAERRGWAER